MYLVAQEITDLKGEFEGGNSLSLDWYAKLRRGAQKTLNSINPESLKRTAPIYGGLTRRLQVYYCPADVEVPMRLHSSDRRLKFDYLPPVQYYANTNKRDYYTIEYINGVRFLVVQHDINVGAVTLEAFDGVNTITGVGLTKNNFNVLIGAVTQMQGTFTDSVFALSRTLTTKLDISTLLYGVGLVPLYFTAAADVSKITLKIKQGANDYHMDSTQDSIGDNLKDGQNFVRFWLQNASKTGTPDPTQIDAWELDIQMKSGKSQTVIVGKLTVQAANFFELDYYSNLLFKDGITGAWKDTPVAGDYINLDRDARGIMHYETARLVYQGLKIEKVNAPSRQSLDTELAREYNQYYLLHPSSAQPNSYNIIPDIARIQEPFDGSSLDFGERIGENAPNDLTSTVNFADDEAILGSNGSQTVFTLLHAPNPSSSLQIFYNGVKQTLGVDFSLAGKTVTMFVAPLVGLPFTATYRYTV